VPGFDDENLAVGKVRVIGRLEEVVFFNSLANIHVPTSPKLPNLQYFVTPKEEYSER